MELHFFRVFDWRGDPVGHDGQAFAWQTPGAFDVAPLLPANTRVLAALALPPVYGITCAADVGEDAFLARFERALLQGLRLIQVREKEWPAARSEQFATTLADVARPFGATLLLNGDAETARRLGLPGVHWTAARLAAVTERPGDLVVAASNNTRDELSRAAALGVDFAVLGPVHATPSHPGMPPLGWSRPISVARLSSGLPSSV